MTSDKVLSGAVIDETMLTLEELARACAVESYLVEMRVEAGLLECGSGVASQWRFASAQLVRARRMVALERDFDANAELAALVTDLIEEVQRLRAQLKAVGSR